ncbi:Hypothetical protein GbCGDNIH3_1629 [Granulibacter bethesdensis]|uniref:Uncharacterized protein n=1 Tax=Granulibacter bethesdensis TaxID=364410 RepID=A0AAN0VGF8_9PROT|nr:Hypothetical protein GbCGDNIH3_1629 [Granulibacter bethesdensis]
MAGAHRVIQVPGLSPRTRRNRMPSPLRSSASGSISAHAEEPEITGQPYNRYTVYLRARGGTSYL